MLRSTTFDQLHLLLLGHADDNNRVSTINYPEYSVLVADDFNAFRNTVNSMLVNLGVVKIDMAASGEEVLDRCRYKKYDIILCDYDLGPGRNGQHVLEELRHRKLLPQTSIFIIISAEDSRNIVMSTYDCEPDDYLVKPISGLMLQQRMERLLKERATLRQVYADLNKDDLSAAADKLTEFTLVGDRYSSIAQKMLGEIFIRQGELQKAEKLYTRALEVRALDWARLGLAKVKHLKGDLDTAGVWLERIVEENPLYLPAYDVLADNWQKKGDLELVQQILERAIAVSPMSILRQKRLAKVADSNEDAQTAIDALRKAIKLGKLSCHGSVQDDFNFARTVSKAIERHLDLPEATGDEATLLLESVRERVDLCPEEVVQILLLNGRLHSLHDRDDKARQCLTQAEEMLLATRVGIESAVDHVDLLVALGERERVEALLVHLQERYADQESALELLDKFLSEPASEANRKMVARANREGIDLYTEGQYDSALACFEKARKLFPKHVGIQLNMVQSLLGKMKNDPSDYELRHQCLSCLRLVDSLVDIKHPQYGRFIRLKKRYETGSE